MAGLIAVRDGDAWSIAVFRNMIPFQRPLAGPMERSLAGERGASYGAGCRRSDAVPFAGKSSAGSRISLRPSPRSG